MLVEIDAEMDSEVDIELANAAGVDADAEAEAEASSEITLEALADVDADADAEVDVEQEALAGLEAETAVDASSEAFAEVDVDALFASTAEADSAAAKKKKKRDIHEEYALGLGELPTDKALPGSLVNLKHAPGAVPGADESTIPDGLLLGEDEATNDPNYEHDILLWDEISAKIKDATAKIETYKVWNKNAVLAVRRIKNQLAQTRKNEKIMKNALHQLRHQRRHSVHKLKEFRLQNDLKMAQKEMDDLMQFETQMIKAKNQVIPGAEDLARRVRTLQSGLSELRAAGADM